MKRPQGQLLTRLRRWRLENGLTLQEEADLTGFSASMISRAERGERVFSPMAKVRMARLLDVRIVDLFEHEQESA
ncbi:MAG: helix-turn-helix domain-containing protein [Actinomycetota bacterium]|nr:helix-turn-helix domain-containing protein [Actinomycetota bacterium]